MSGRRVLKPQKRKKIYIKFVIDKSNAYCCIQSFYGKNKCPHSNKETPKSFRLRYTTYQGIGLESMRIAIKDTPRVTMFC
jgi:hypothetical protein